MKNQILVKGLMVVIASLAIACTPKQQERATAPVIDKEQVKKDIQARENEFAEVYNSGVLKNIGYYADDAISFSQNKAPLVGKPAIIKYLVDGRDSSAAGIKITFVTNEVFPCSDGSQVVEVGYYKLVDSTDAVLNTGNYIVLFEKRDGKYVSIRDMSASDMPLEY
jgi:ketosteroid isomerase-like protein